MRVRDLTAAALLLGPLVACGGSKGPDGGGPGPTVTSITISPGTDMLKIKGTESYQATAAYTNGTTAAVTPAWRSDNPAVLTIEGSGRATANASGTATITAEHEGRSGTKLVRVVPDYGGNWRGIIVLRNCQAEGAAWAAGCAEMSPGELDTLSMAVTQQGAGITATLDLGGFAGPVTGSIAMDGTLSVTGTYSTTLEGFPIDFTVVEWQTMSTDNARMTGRGVFTMRSSMVPGQARLDFDLQNVSKSTTLNAPRDVGGGLARAFRRVIRR